MTIADVEFNKSKKTLRRPDVIRTNSVSKNYCKLIDGLA